MRFDWGDFLQLARDISQAGSGDALAEAKWRAAASRAYYAAYHTADAYYKRTHNGSPAPTTRHRLGGGSRNLDLHAALIEGLKDTEAEPAATVGRLLSTVKATRVNADYRSDARVSDQDAALAVETAQEIMDVLGT